MEQTTAGSIAAAITAPFRMIGDTTAGRSDK